MNDDQILNGEQYIMQTIRCNSQSCELGVKVYVGQERMSFIGGDSKDEIGLE